MTFVHVDLADRIGTLTIDRPDKANSLCHALLAELHTALVDLVDRGARVVVLRAQPGVKVWSAGYDIDELPSDHDPLSWEEPLEDVLRKVQALPVPVIAMIEGSVWGGACDLVLTCDITVGSERASFALTPAKLGLAYNPSGLNHVVNVAGLHKAKEMLFTARQVTADDALRSGILNHCVPADELETFTFAMATTIARNSPAAIRSMKEQFRLLTVGQPLDPERWERLQSLRRASYAGADYAEGVAAFHEKRHPEFGDLAWHEVPDRRHR